MFCSKCGANVPDNATVCNACGQPTGGLPVPQAAAVAVAVPGVVVRPGVQYAGFWLRFVAWIIDRILLQVAAWIILLPFMGSLGFRGMFGHPSRPEDAFLMLGSVFRFALIAFAIEWLYYALLESSSWQATLGKKALGLEVTDLQGHRISFGRATGRFFGKIISAIILWIGFIMAGFTEKKQALHDILAGCLVIRKV